MGSSAAPYSNTALGATAALVKAGPRSLSNYHIQNTAAAISYVQFFDAAAAADVTVGTTTPTFVLGVIASGTVACALTRGLQFTNGIVVASTTTATGSTGATTVVTLGVGD